MRNTIRQMFIIALTLLSGVLCAQHKLVFRKHMHRVVLKTGTSIGITKREETFIFRNWLTDCSRCVDQSCMDSVKHIKDDTTYWRFDVCIDTICENNIWTLDSISQTYIVLRRLSGDSSKYRIDSIQSGEMDTYARKMKRKKQEYYYLKEIPAADSNYAHNICVLAVPIDYDRERISYDSIQSYSFAREESCSGFGLEVPLFALCAAIGAPIAAADKSNPHFSWPTLIVGEAVAGYISWSMIHYIRRLRVRTYSVNEWKVKVK